MTGGGGLWGLTASTEILETGAASWRIVETAELAIPLFGMRGVTHDNMVYMIGQYKRWEFGLRRSHKASL